jgi:hypothetical protein
MAYFLPPTTLMTFASLLIHNLVPAVHRPYCAPAIILALTGNPDKRPLAGRITPEGTLYLLSQMPMRLFGHTEK